MKQVCEAAEDETVPLSVPMATAAGTSIRLLTRIVPFLLEDKDDEVVRDILWRPGGYVDPEKQPANSDEAPAATAKEPAAEGEAAPSVASPPSPAGSAAYAAPAADADAQRVVCAN